MDTIDRFTQKLMDSFSNAGGEILAGLSNVVGALIVLLLGWLITMVIVFILKRALKLVRLDKLSEKINTMKLFGKGDFKFNLTNAIIIFVKWILFLVFLIIAADIMAWDFVSKEIGNLLRYLPRLFSAIALFMIGIYIASFVKNAIRGFYESLNLSGSKIISNLVFYIIAIIITVTALDQAGIDTTVITNNITIILGAFLLAISIAFGLGSKDVVKEILLTFYTRKNYDLGDTVKINNVEGSIEAIDNISMTITTATGKTIIPIKEVVESQVEIISKKE